MKIFFDLDGTLIESRFRLYNLFIDLAYNQEISFDRYWQLKRSKFDNEWILANMLGYKKEQIIDFTKKWMTLIETDEYLKYNSLFEFTLPVLENLNKAELFIVTARQFKEKAIEETIKFKIREYFSDILVSDHYTSKDEIILKNGINIQPDDIFVGDTGNDILAGKKLKIKTIGVLSGFRGHDTLIEYAPDFLINDISHLKLVLHI